VRVSSRHDETKYFAAGVKRRTVYLERLTVRSFGDDDALMTGRYVLEGRAAPPRTGGAYAPPPRTGGAYAPRNLFSRSVKRDPAFGASPEDLRWYGSCSVEGRP